MGLCPKVSLFIACECSKKGKETKIKKFFELKSVEYRARRQDRDDLVNVMQ